MWEDMTAKDYWCMIIGGIAILAFGWFFLVMLISIGG